MTLTISQLKQMPFAAIDLQFASYLCSLNGKDEPLLFAAAAIASTAVRKGHTCCNLRAFDQCNFSDFFRKISSDGTDWNDDLPDMPFPSEELIRNILKPPAGIAMQQDSSLESVKNIPLILDPDGRLYLNRYFMYENELAKRLLSLLDKEEQPFHPEKEEFNHVIRFFHMENKSDVTVDWQKFSAFLSGFSRFSIITGGPGTGKTTVVTAVLALILEKSFQEKKTFPKIMLCAPTGKAQSRLADSIRDSLKDLSSPDEVKAELKRIIAPENQGITCGTVHSLLGTVRNTPNFRKNEKDPLDADILLADEVSMISLPLMCKLFRALKPETKLILLGDKDQLASVEAGAVLSEFCRNTEFNVLSEERKKEFARLTDIPEQEISLLPEKTVSPLTGHIAELKVVRRFDKNSKIGKISSMIRERKDILPILPMISGSADDFIRKDIPDFIPAELKKFFGDLPQKIVALKQEPSIENMRKAYFLLENHKILCALRGGDNGVEKINEFCRQIFGMEEEESSGLPLMILKNDKLTGLSNGDTGIMWNNGKETKVYFPGSENDSEPKSFYPFELPENEPVFAMTIHKSQGSGFNHILISLPGKDTPVLSRELVYTAITRAKKSVELWSPESLLKTALQREVIRHSGLADRLRNPL